MQTKIKLKTNYLVLALLSFILVSQPSHSQTNDPIQSNASFAEKIYLQLDANAYTLGNIVWFKCMVLNACDHVPSSLSSVLYAELITPGEIIKEKKLIKIENGISFHIMKMETELDTLPF